MVGNDLQMTCMTYPRHGIVFFLVRNVEAKALAAGRAQDVNCIGHDAAQRALFEEDESDESVRPFQRWSLLGEEIV